MFRTDVEIGARVGDLRRAAGLTQAELGARIGIDQAAVSRIESGERELDVHELLELSRLLGVAPDTILEVEDGEPALLRASEEDSPAVRHALDVFDQVISTFWSARALARLR